MGPFLKKSHLLVQEKLTFCLANNYENSHAQCILFTSIILMCMFFLVKKYAICSWFEVLIIKKITSLMLIFSFYIAICSQTLRIILHQHKKRHLLKVKHFEKPTKLITCWGYMFETFIYFKMAIIIFFTVPKVLI